MPRPAPALSRGSVVTARSAGTTSGISPGNLSDADWSRATVLVADLATQHGFGAATVVVDRPGDHEVSFPCEYGGELLFGAAANTTLSLTTGCHLTREAYLRGPSRPGGTARRGRARSRSPRHRNAVVRARISWTRTSITWTSSTRRTAAENTLTIRMNASVSATMVGPFGRAGISGSVATLRECHEVKARYCAERWSVSRWFPPGRWECRR